MKKIIIGIVIGIFLSFVVVCVIGYYSYNPESRKKIGNIATKLQIAIASKDKVKIEKSIHDLLAESEKVSLNGSEEFRIKYQIAKTYAENLNNIPYALKYYREAEKIIPKGVVDPTITAFYKDYAGILADKGEDSEAIKKLEKAMYISQELDDKNALFGALEFTASLYGNLKNIEKMKYYFNEAENIMAERKKDFDEEYYYDLGLLHNNRAYTLYELKQYKEAQVDALKSIEIYESDKAGEGRHSMLPSVYDTVAVINLELSDLKSALEYEQKAYEKIKYNPITSNSDFYKNYAKILFANSLHINGCKMLGTAIESFKLNGNDKEVLGLKRIFKEKECDKSS